MDTQEFWDDYQHLKKEVSKLRNSEARLKATRARYRTLLNELRVLVAVIDRDSVLVEMNPAGLRLLERTEQEIVGAKVEQAFREDQAAEIGRRAKEAISSDSTVRFDWTLPRLTGPALWLAAKASPIRDETNRTVAALVIARDTTGLLSMDEDLSEIQDRVDTLRQHVRDQLD